MIFSLTPERAAASATEVETSPIGMSLASRLRIVEPPPVPAMKAVDIRGRPS